MQNTIKKFDLKINNLTSAIDEVKNYISEYHCPEISMDLSAFNVIDAARVLVVSSAYHYGKYPEGKITCRYCSDEIMDLVSGIAAANLEVMCY